MVLQPYRESYYQKRRKAIWIGLLVVGVGAVLYWLFFGLGNRRPGQEYIGKIVQVTGSISEIGEVVSYRPRESIILKTLSTRFTVRVPCTLALWSTFKAVSSTVLPPDTRRHDFTFCTA